MAKRIVLMNMIIPKHRLLLWQPLFSTHIKKRQGANQSCRSKKSFTYSSLWWTLWPFIILALSKGFQLSKITLYMEMGIGDRDKAAKMRVES